MIIIHKQYDYDHPLDKCWRVIADFDNWSAWSVTKSFLSKSCYRFTLGPGQALGPGMLIEVESGRRQIHRLLAREWQPPHKVGLEMQGSGRFDAEIAWTLTPLTSIRTQLDLRINCEIKGFLGSLAAMLPLQKHVEKKVDLICQQAGRTLNDA